MWDRREAVALQVLGGDLDLQVAYVVGQEERRRAEVGDLHPVAVDEVESTAEAGKGQEIEDCAADRATPDDEHPTEGRWSEARTIMRGVSAAEVPEREPDTAGAGDAHR